MFFHPSTMDGRRECGLCVSETWDSVWRSTIFIIDVLSSRQLSNSCNSNFNFYFKRRDRRYKKKWIFFPTFFLTDNITEITGLFLRFMSSLSCFNHLLRSDFQGLNDLFTHSDLRRKCSVRWISNLDMSWITFKYYSSY